MDQILKQRLIGAIVIIALAVIFIPMILEGPDNELSPHNQEMPPPPTIDFQTEVELPVPEEPTESPGSLASTASEQEASAMPEPPVSQPEAVTSEAEAPAKQAEPVESAKTAKPAKPVDVKQPSSVTPPRTATASTQGGWILQVGSFSQQGNALSLRDRLKKSGYQVSVKEVKGAEGTIHRVLIGPVNDRPAAEKLRDKLASELKLTAMVLENK